MQRLIGEINVILRFLQKEVVQSAPVLPLTVTVTSGIEAEELDRALGGRPFTEIDWQVIIETNAPLSFIEPEILLKMAPFILATPDIWKHDLAAITSLGQNYCPKSILEVELLAYCPAIGNLLDAWYRFPLQN
jgi:hypothetical protein